MSAKLLPRVLLDPPSQLDAQATTMARGRYVRVAGGVFHTGLASGLSLFVEEKRRRAELSMYVLPKALESFWRVATGEGSWRS